MTDGTQGGARPAWEFADAWIFAAIGSGTPHDDLSGLLRSADHYNHSAPSETEVGQAIGRLAASDLVRAHRGYWRPTAKGGTLLNRAQGGGYAYLASLLAVMSDTPMVEGTWVVPPGAFNRAYRRYMHPFTWRLPPRRKRFSTRGRH